MITFIDRVAGAMRLDAGTYEDVEANPSANLQALAVVVLASLSAGIGAATGQDDTPLRFMLGVMTLTLLAWVSWAFVVYMVGSVILPTKDTRTDIGELLRTLGFAASPGLLQVFATVPGARTVVFAVCIVWTLAATVVAVRQALDFKSTGRAIAVCGLSWALSFLMAVLLGLVFGPRLLAGW
jgi:hypothetical protein